jgi:hypothetical protein
MAVKRPSATDKLGAQDRALEETIVDMLEGHAGGAWSRQDDLPV